jgi:DNA gyrase/topoisomerase IV subunit B
MPDLVENGFVYTQPPLYKVNAGRKRHQGREIDVRYLMRGHGYARDDRQSHDRGAS